MTVEEEVEVEVEEGHNEHYTHSLYTHSLTTYPPTHYTNTHSLTIHSLTQSLTHSITHSLHTHSGSVCILTTDWLTDCCTWYRSVVSSMGCRPYGSLRKSPRGERQRWYWNTCRAIYIYSHTHTRAWVTWHMIRWLSQTDWLVYSAYILSIAHHTLNIA